VHYIHEVNLLSVDRDEDPNPSIQCLGGEGGQKRFGSSSLQQSKWCVCEGNLVPWVLGDDVKSIKPLGWIHKHWLDIFRVK
jgi:hypothetical protein